MINLENPKKFQGLVDMTRQVSTEMFRPISRKYDRAEHTYPKELDTLRALLEGMNEGDPSGGVSASGGRSNKQQTGNVNGGNISTVLSVAEACWGDTSFVLTMPGQGLGNAAIAAVADDEQMARFGDKWASMAITEPHFGSDSAAVKTTAILDEETGEYVLNGTKIFVTSGERCDVVVVWASVDPSLGRAAIKSFIVPRDNPGLELVRLEHKLGIRGSDTAQFALVDCRIPKENLLGTPEVEVKKGFAGVMQTFDNTRPMVAAMAVGVAKASLERTFELLKEAGVEIDYDKPAHLQIGAAAELLRLESDYEAFRLLTLEAAWMADNRKPNSVNASMAKAKAGRGATEIALKCVELCGAAGYGEDELLEKWARDAKILDIFEGTQQIQLLIIARNLLGKSSAELK
ncbi:putative acyl-CoA dehydrogenase [Patulibacter medicamentivorans]|uniref:Putative acyl-CoA dehydrogenase n=1 Tax=Patulibacter medicamentivorans TaxID=1097667 RepID=H0E963_9ACTN|nr:acyl-CoA dehydrogenase family protein [Patulibacter medicamentivorans]EHN09801.1 putative acyl-CoA dehydrogenase [Patulibacter medicamentivorans]